jgi:glycosyltransferase involved in cell wall biosynthesis
MSGNPTVLVTGDGPPVEEPVTVVIPTLNGADVLPRQLAALDAQDFARRFHVIVVDNGSTDRTTPVAEAHQQTGYELEVVHEPRRGINFARNAGIDAAADGVILLCDADDEVHQGWISAMVAALEPDTWVGGVLDYTRLNSSRTREVWDVDDHSTAVTVIDPYVDRTYGCNCGFSRQMWEEVGRFDPRLSGTGGDENEMFMRAHQAGYRRIVVDDAIVSYRLRPGVRRMVRQRYRQGRNQVLMRTRPGGRLLPQQFTTSWLVRRLLFTLAAAPAYLGSTRRRCSWLGSCARHVGRLVGTWQYRAER